MYSSEVMCNRVVDSFKLEEFGGMRTAQFGDCLAKKTEG